MAGANLTVELPAELLAQNAEYQMTQLRQRLRKSQMTMELYCKSAGLTPEQVREATAGKPSASCGQCWRCAPLPKPKRSP